MKSFFSPIFLSICLAPCLLFGKDIVPAGAGSYTTQLPAGAKTPPEKIYRTANVPGPMPTNDWWSSLAWTPLSFAMYPHPLAVRAMGGGLRVAYPGANVTANQAAIFAFMGGDGPEDFVIGHSGVESFAEANVDGHSDWFVSALFEKEGKKLRTTFGHGSPYVFAEITGGNPTLSFGKELPKIWSGDASAAVLGITVQGRHYGIFAPKGSAWTGLDTVKWTADTKGKTYFSIAVLPDVTKETLDLFTRHAHHHVTSSKVFWSFDEKTAAVKTTFEITTKSQEGTGEGTLFALYPHQWLNTAAKLGDKFYNSVRGPMKITEGTAFTTEMKFPGVLLGLPLVAGEDKAKLDVLLGDITKEKAPLVGDTYALGKQLGKWATALPIAEQTGNRAVADELTGRMTKSLENFLSAANSQGAVKSKDEGLFYYEPTWGTLIGYPASFGSDIELNDHHFHYGYFLRAAGEIALRNPAWAGDDKWGAMIKLLIRDIASADRGDKLFPFLRNFDPYAGHTWASGHARFADGNNNESSSEAMNAWHGLILWGEVTGDKALRDLGVWLYTTEMEAINHYWFDVTDQFHPKDYPASVVTMVWGGKGANGTWFSGNPEAVHGINWLPVTSASLYLGRYPDYVNKNYMAMLAENREDNAKKAAKGGKAAILTPTGQGEQWDEWADIIWMYRALSDPKDALRQWEARPADFKPEAGNSLANASHWIHVLNALGQVDRQVTADCPFYAVFTKDGKKTHLAYNTGAKPRVVRFSDGVSVTCPSHGFGRD